jgi:hypothetical protein
VPLASCVHLLGPTVPRQRWRPPPHRAARASEAASFLDGGASSWRSTTSSWPCTFSGRAAGRPPCCARVGLPLVRKASCSSAQRRHQGGARRGRVAQIAGGRAGPAASSNGPAVKAPPAKPVGTTMSRIFPSFHASFALFVWLISRQPAVLFSQNKSATSNASSIFLSQQISTSQTNMLLVLPCQPVRDPVPEHRRSPPPRGRGGRHRTLGGSGSPVIDSPARSPHILAPRVNSSGALRRDSGRRRVHRRSPAIGAPRGRYIRQTCLERLPAWRRRHWGIFPFDTCGPTNREGIYRILLQQKEI